MFLHGFRRRWIYERHILPRVAPKIFRVGADRAPLGVSSEVALYDWWPTNYFCVHVTTDDTILPTTWRRWVHVGNALLAFAHAPDYYLNGSHFVRVGGPDSLEYSLTIPRVTLDDTGVYSVTARNVVGEAKSILSLQIFARGKTKSGWPHGGALYPIRNFDWFYPRASPELSFVGTTLSIADLPRRSPNSSHMHEARFAIAVLNESSCITAACDSISPHRCLVNHEAQLIISWVGPNRFVFMSSGLIDIPPVDSSPQILEGLKDIRCCDGDSASFECRVRGKPSPRITWTKDGMVILDSKDFRYETEGQSVRLHLNRVYAEDEGLYACVAANEIGKAMTRANLYVGRVGEFAIEAPRRLRHRKYVMNDDACVMSSLLVVTEDALGGEIA
ncbi:unnamed protein product [Notodromas monacha]|uniref:Ig-like domain-containing protein n=1 Tax=Notodromas monacha TaxID=399045 RepID=A0A7R9GAS3_9CRUS|nr:unnamed protein product [Notodromas monacha]CAG0914299.1 unnamed protein product [Notodromas monacha]